MLYWLRHAAALAGVSVMTAVKRQCSVFCSAGAIWCVLRLPSPQSANPNFLRESAASARVTLVLMKGAAAIAAACARKVRRAVMGLSILTESSLKSAAHCRGVQEIQSPRRPCQGVGSRLWSHACRRLPEQATRTSAAWGALDDNGADHLR